MKRFPFGKWLARSGGQTFVALEACALDPSSGLLQSSGAQIERSSQKWNLEALGFAWFCFSFVSVKRRSINFSKLSIWCVPATQLSRLTSVFGLLHKGCFVCMLRIKHF